MHAFIKHSFWSDSRVEEIPAEQKLALIWLITNSGRDICGFCKPTQRRFEFETGIPFEALGRGCQALPSSFRILSCGTYFAVNFVRHQFSKAGVVTTKNRAVQGVVKLAQALPNPLQGVFFEAYPELLAELADFRINHSSREGDAIPMTWGKDRIGKDREEKNLSEDEHEEKPNSSAITAEHIVAAYPRREALAACLAIVASHIDEGCDPETILAGTRAIAAEIAQAPSGARNTYVTGAEKFFREKRWQDDPATWRTRFAGKTHNGAPSAPADLGGRQPSRTLKLG